MVSASLSSHDIMTSTRRGFMSDARESPRRSARRYPEEPVKKLLQALAGKFSTSLGIDLTSGNSGEIFKWFLASILFGARISEKIAANTYREFARKGVVTPKAFSIPAGMGWWRCSTI